MILFSYGPVFVCQKTLFTHLEAILFSTFYFLNFLGNLIAVFPIYNVWVQLNHDDVYWLVLTIVLGSLILNAVSLVASAIIILMFLRGPTGMEFMYYRPVAYAEKPKMMLSPQMPVQMMMMPIPAAAGY